MDKPMNRYRVPAILLIAASLQSGCADEIPTTGTWERTARGVIVSPAEGTAARVRLEAVADDIIRVTAFPTEDLALPESLMTTAESSAAFDINATGGTVVLKTARAQASVSLATGLVQFVDADGEALLAESSRAPFTPVTSEGEDYYEIRQQWNRGSDEGFYGLGQHQNE
jgi:alpha-D-xyloside xylohydrolase